MPLNELSENLDLSLDAVCMLENIIEHVAHYLPEQAPIHAFVHHNTLHTFEDLSFKEALSQASKIFHANPFMGEKAYREAYAKGRILNEDITAILTEQVADLDAPIVDGGPLRKAWLHWRLSNLFDVPSQSSVRWWLHEQNLLNIPHALSMTASRSEASTLYQSCDKKIKEQELNDLWELLEQAFEAQYETDISLRLRDFYIQHSGIDTDEWVHPMLIKLSSAYLDQGIANHAMVLRDKGFVQSFWHFLMTPSLLSEPWMKWAKKQYRQLCHLTSTELIAHLLAEMRIDKQYWTHVIHDTLQSLRGWAGMFRQFEKHPDKVPIHNVPATLTDFLAVQLLLDLSAAHFAAKRTGIGLNQVIPVTKGSHAYSIEVYEAFVSAQAFGLPTSLFKDESCARTWIEEHRRFNDFERRYLMQLAYERRHRHHILDAISEHQSLSAKGHSKRNNRCQLQAIFCMDEREESTRRHLEEVAPDTETYGCPGFFGVAMQFKGFDDAVSRPLCPVTITPKHYIEEISHNSESSQYQQRRKSHGKLIAGLRKIENAVLGQALWTVASAPLHSISLVLHSLFPRIANKLTHHITEHHAYRPDTTLALFRENEAKNEQGWYQGYSYEEASDVVASMLNSMGLTTNFAPIVLVVGHGSSSLNNPHEAAHDCGATGGGRGGPNARAFAMMANNPEVRQRLKQSAIDIPKGTRFIGAYHNTADESMEYYDLASIPASHSEIFALTKQKLFDACMYSAQERCRRFEDAPHHISADEALKVVQRHAADLAQPRPEYGHATNAVCIIGRRGKTKGLFLDRRAFLISYNPDLDDDGTVVANILQSAGPVGAGINLEYYFSYVDPHTFGCGTKLPHNIAGLVGVMNGHSSDLRTGLPWQMVEIHEPVRLLVVVEATPERLLKVAQDKPVVGKLVVNQWIQLVSWHPNTGELQEFHNGGFRPYHPQSRGFSSFPKSAEAFSGTREHLACAHITENS